MLIVKNRSILQQKMLKITPQSIPWIRTHDQEFLPITTRAGLPSSRSKVGIAV